MCMPEVYISSKRGHVKFLKENHPIAVNGKSRRRVEISYRGEVARNNGGEIILFVSLVCSTSC